MNGHSLSPHLLEAEFLATQHRNFLDEQEAAWKANPVLKASAQRFAATVFEPVRDLLGPLAVTSGYRCPELNAAVGGAGGSRHMLGLAADVIPIRRNIAEAMIELRQAMADGRLPEVDQAIFEYGRWIHLQAADIAHPPRQMCLMVFSRGVYLPFDAADERVVSRRMA